ncbi:MAG TPA: NTP transferase domain-containing protein [Pyrinomonadaceae bacterium]
MTGSENLKIGAVVKTVCDHPFVNADTIGRLVTRFQESDKQIIATEYDSVRCTVAISRESSAALAKLGGDKRARDLIRDPRSRSRRRNKRGGH